MAFYLHFLTELCCSQVSECSSRGRGWKTCSWVSHWVSRYLRRSTPYPHIPHRNKHNPTHMYCSVFNGKWLQGRTQQQQVLPLHPRQEHWCSFLPLTLTLAHPLPSQGCVVWVLQKLIKRSTFYSVSSLARAVITLASYFSSWLIAFNSLLWYIWFTGSCKSSRIGWVSFLNNTFDCL